jgi:hypothetical protein
MTVSLVFAEQKTKEEISRGELRRKWLRTIEAAGGSRCFKFDSVFEALFTALYKVMRLLVITLVLLVNFIAQKIQLPDERFVVTPGKTSTGNVSLAIVSIGEATFTSLG